jgi:hypothetical protein
MCNLVDFALNGTIKLGYCYIMYKHKYHPFYLGKLFKHQTNVLFVNKIVHLNWWCGWGFEDEDNKV